MHELAVKACHFSLLHVNRIQGALPGVLCVGSLKGQSGRVMNMAFGVEVNSGWWETGEVPALYALVCKRGGPSINDVHTEGGRLGWNNSRVVA